MRRYFFFALLAAATSMWLTRLAAQAVERTDTPRRGALRVTFDPHIVVWEQEYTRVGRQSIGAALSGDSAAPVLPSVARLQQDVRALTGIAGYVASLGHELLAVRADRRVMPIGFEYGVTPRLSIGITVPIVRVNVREGFRQRPLGGNIGLVPGEHEDSLLYNAFLSHLGTAMAQLQDSIDAGAYGCPSAACTRANEVLTQGQALLQALDTAVHGAGTLYLPLAGSAAGLALTGVVAALQRALVDTFLVTPFALDTFLLPASATVAGSDVASLLAARTNGLDLAPYLGTPRRLRFFSGDVEVTAKYRFVSRAAYAAAAQLVVRLPTGHQDSPNDPFDIATGDHQTDLEGRLTGELTLWGRIWLNVSLRGALQLTGDRERRVGPVDQLFLPATTLARLRWDPGDYAAVDFAPMYRFSRNFAAGMTAAYSTQGRDRYAFLSPQDSVTLATQMGGPVGLAVLEPGTAIRRARLGFAVTYSGPRLEGGFSVERTVSGAGGPVPVATVFRIVMRQTILLF
jgi:hypothetical protein